MNTSSKRKTSYPKALAIGSSDPSGGGGIQAHLKTFSALQCFGMSALACLTVQNTQGLKNIETVTPEVFEEQIRAILEDIGADVIVVGMLFTPEHFHIVSEILKEFPQIPVVLDPVMVATQGERLIQGEAIKELIEHLIPLSTVLTPNLPEASVLLRRPIRHMEEMEEAAQDLLKLGSQAVILKGGHLPCRPGNDCLTLDRQCIWLKTKPVKTVNLHGAGATLAAALAAHLAYGDAIETAAHRAKEYLTQALKSGAHYSLGRGGGPVHHFHPFWGR